jgi:hypothetical protein
MYRLLAIGGVVVALVLPVVLSSCGPAICPGSCNPSPFAQAISPFARAIDFHPGTPAPTARSLVQRCRNDAVAAIGPFKSFGNGHSQIAFIGWSSAVPRTNRGREKESHQIAVYRKCLSHSPTVIGLSGLGA